MIAFLVSMGVGQVLLWSMKILAVLCVVQLGFGVMNAIIQYLARKDDNWVKSDIKKDFKAGMQFAWSLILIVSVVILFFALGVLIIEI